MIQNVVRGLVAVVGVFGLFVAVRFWMDPVGPGAQLGLAALNELGYSSLRADLGSFFGVGGLFALTAAIRNDRRWALVPLAMFGFALSARLASAAGHGFGEVIQPIAVEAAFTALMALAARVLGRG